MKLLLLTLAVASVAYGGVVKTPENGPSIRGYLKNSVKIAERIRQQEEEFLSTQNRIIGGLPAGLGQYPFQAGLVLDIVGIQGARGVCGASLITTTRLLSAAHCWFDGDNQAWRVEVALGTNLLFSGGHRQYSSVFVNHPNWMPALIRNDVGIIFLANPVPLSSTIAPVALPSGSQLQENFVGESAIISGFGATSDERIIAPDQFLSHVRVNVIGNNVCRFAFPLILQDNNICTSGAGNVGACGGDSGGPLVIVRNNLPILVGVVSFGSGISCEIGLPSVYARTTSFLSFINQHI